MREYKNPLTIRGDSLYCPLAFGADSYWGCPYNCVYCYCREMNAVWGQDLRVVDPEALARRMRNGLSNNNPRSPLAHALRNKSTLRLGNKSDPFPPEEQIHRATEGILGVLKELDWSVKLETRSTAYTESPYWELLTPGRCVLTTTVTCGLDRDHEAFEPSGMPPPAARLEALHQVAAEGFQVGVVSEPFLNGWHTVDDWRQFLDALRQHGINRTNVYHAHLTPFVAKRLVEVPGLDIEAVWRGNEDAAWRPILREIIQLSEAAGVILGCPDFVNSGRYIERSNTCCGVDVPRPTTYNMIGWKHLAISQGRVSREDVLASWDGIGDQAHGEAVFDGSNRAFYGFKDLGWARDGDGWRPEEEKPRGFF